MRMTRKRRRKFIKKLMKKRQKKMYEEYFRFKVIPDIESYFNERKEHRGQTVIIKGVFANAKQA